MNLTENGIRLLSECAPRLTVFKAEGCTHVRDDDRRAPNENLRHLDDEQCGDGLGKELSSPDFSRSQSMFGKKTKTSLSSVDVRFALKSLTDHGLIALIQSCPLLETLIIANCTTLTDQILVTLGRSCHQLKYVDLPNKDDDERSVFRKLDATLCSQFTDTGFLAMAQVSAVESLPLLNDSEVHRLGLSSSAKN